MATPMSRDSVVVVSVTGTKAGQRFITSQPLGNRNTSGTAFSDYVPIMQDILEEVSDGGSILPLYRDACGVDVSFVALTAQPVWPIRLRAVTLGLSVTGNISTLPATPPNVAGVITKRASLATRRGVGTAHIPCGVASDIVAGSWGGDTRDALASLALRWEETWAELPDFEFWDPILWSPRTPTARLTIVNCFTQESVRVMRRRTLGLGI